MSDQAFSGRASSQTGSAQAAHPVVPSDTDNLPWGLTRALHVGGAGMVVIMDSQGNLSTLASHDAQYHPIRVKRVLAAGTTATGIVALY